MNVFIFNRKSAFYQEVRMDLRKDIHIQEEDFRCFNKPNHVVVQAQSECEKNCRIWKPKRFAIYRVFELNLENCFKHYQGFVYWSTWSCKMSYKQKFCGLSEYVRL